MSHKRNDGNYEDKDEARTPPSLFKKLDERFHFNVDCCASHENTLCNQIYWTKDIPIGDYKGGGFLSHLAILDKTDVAYCNPPYSNPEPFIAKCADESLKGALVAMLLPVDTSTKYFHKYIMGNDFEEDGTPVPNEYGASEIIYLLPRVKFLNPDGTPMKGSPLTASQVVVFKQEDFDGSPVISSMLWK